MSTDVYETPHGWRYRAGSRDDGNYASRDDAAWAAEQWSAEHPDTPENDNHSAMDTDAPAF